MIVKTDIDTIEAYLTDASNLKGKSNKLIIPENKDELKTVIKELFNQNQNFVISAAGTGLTGGRVPKDDTIISIEKLNNILEINPEKKFVRVEPGVTLNQLEEAISLYNLFLPPNPTEKNSSLGGNVVNNSSGSRSFKYGSIRNYVEALEIILSNGETFNLNRGNNFADGNKLSLITDEKSQYNIEFDEITPPNTKHSGGYYLKYNMDAIDLFIGSEGTLGVISEIKLSVAIIPEKVLGLLVFFDDEYNLLEFTEKIREKSLITNKVNIDTNSDIAARLIEFFDEKSLDLIRNKYPQIPAESKGAIWIEQEYSENFENEILEKWFEIISKYSLLADSTWVATNEKEHNNFREFRHQIPLTVNEIISRNGMRKIGTDTAVPSYNFREYYFYVKEKLTELQIDYVVFGHIGDSHLHANIFPKNEAETKKALDFYEMIMLKAINLGGTVSAEHGIGKIKKNYLKMMIGDKGITSMKKIKNILDPKNLLGKGNLFD
ncbi:MAG: FAD-binding oxidoreductase [Candidatus Kapabacteria bacterium]|nr:FAD-binding oxidoreductase [Candidatus Kapabacteria bacterium]